MKKIRITKNCITGQRVFSAGEEVDVGKGGPLTPEGAQTLVDLGYAEVVEGKAK